MFHCLWILPAILLAMILLPYLLGPLLTYVGQRYTVPTEIVPIDPATYPFAASVRVQFADGFEKLTQDGFDLAGIISLPRLLPNLQALCAVYVNRRTCEMANTTYIVGQALPENLLLQYTEFVTRYKDGMILQTNNSAEIGAFPTPPEVHTLQFWNISDVLQLHALHQFHMKQREAHQQRHNPPINRLDDEFGGNLERYFAKGAIDEVFAGQLDTGYLTRTPTGYRPTIKGALIMTWQNLWPFANIRKNRRAAAAQALLQEMRRAGTYPA